MLIEVKEQLPHGEFREMVDVKLSFSRQLAVRPFLAEEAKRVGGRPRKEEGAKPA